MKRRKSKRKETSKVGTRGGSLNTVEEIKKKKTQGKYTKKGKDFVINESLK